jgi:hypothetical protein
MPDTELQIQEQIIQLINPDLSPEASITLFIDKLGEYINYLIQNNFQQLISILYKIDINEKTLRQLLQTDKDKNAGNVIAKLIIARQLKKIDTRKSFINKDDIPGEEKW